MSKKSSKFLLVFIVIISLISTFSFASDSSVYISPAADDSELLVTTTSAPTGSNDGSDDGSDVDTDLAVDESSLEDETVTDGTKQSVTVDTDLYLRGKEVTISDIVNGNAFVLAEKVTVTGQIGGDLYVIANTIDFEGSQIYGNVFAIADSINLNGLIYDFYAICNTLTRQFQGVVYRDLRVICNTATINGVVGKDANFIVGNLLTVQYDCMIYGNLTYTSLQELKLAPSPEEKSEEASETEEADEVNTEVTIKDIVTGTVDHKSFTESFAEISNAQVNIVDYILGLLTIVIYTLVVWLIVTKFSPKFYGKITDGNYQKMLIAILVGLLGIIVVPVIAVLLLFTIVGAPISIALLLVYALLLLNSFSITSIAIAGKLAEKAKALAQYNNLFAVIISTVVLWLLSIIPYVGFLFVFVAVLCGFGLILMSFYNKKEEKKVTEETKTEKK